MHDDMALYQGSSQIVQTKGSLKEHSKEKEQHVICQSGYLRDYCLFVHESERAAGLLVVEGHFPCPM